MRFLPALVIVIATLLSPKFSFADYKLTDWKAYTSLVNSQSATVDSSGNLWIATSGGIYYYNPQTADYRDFRNIDALASIDIRTIAYNPERDEIVAGSADGYLSIWDHSGKWQNFGDVHNQGFSDPEITDIKFYGGNIYISGGWGLAVFDPVKKIFTETIRRFGDFQSNVKANSILIRNDSIWVATEAGIAYNSLKSQISDRNTWKVFDQSNGLTFQTVSDIGYWNGSLYALSKKNVYKLTDTIFQSILQDDYLVGLRGDSKHLYVASLFNVNVDLKTVLNEGKVLPANLSGFAIIPSSDTARVIYFYDGNGIGIYDHGNNEHYLPNSPLSSLISDIAIAEDNSFWCTTGEATSGKGFAHCSNGIWENYSVKTNPEIKIDAYDFISLMDNGDILVSGYGSGLLYGALGNDDSYHFKLYDSSNSAFVGVDGKNFIVAGQTVMDRNGYVWCTNMGLNSAGPIAVAFDKDFKSYPIYTNLTANNRNFYNLVIDFSGTKWMGSFPEYGVGLLYSNDNGTPTDPTDDKQGLLTVSSTAYSTAYPNLLSNDCNSLAIDKTGVLWIGTKNGLAAIVNPSSALSSKPSFIVRTVKDMADKFVNDVMVDALDNKWIATSSGIWVFNSDATEILAIINKANSPLPTDDVKSISTNPATGEIFFATRNGLYVAKSMSVAPNENYDISCYPQPFDPNRDSELIIDGLAGASEIRILTTNGELVQSINTNSRKVAWNGLDKSGSPVGNGVYLVVTVSGETKTSSVQKIAVVRK